MSYESFITILVWSSVVWYLRYLDTYCEYWRFDTSIEEVLIYCDISWSHDTAKYRDMTIPALIPCNHCIDNCRLRDSNENRTSHQNHFCKLVICLQFAHALISGLSKRHISCSLSLWHFVSFCDLTVVQLMGVQSRRMCYRPTLACSGWWRSFVCAVSHTFFTYLDYTSFAKVLQYCIMTNIDDNYVESLDCECRTETVLSLTSLKLISVEIIQENKFVAKSLQNNWRLMLAQFRDD